MPVMELIYQTNLFCTVKNMGVGELLAETSLIGTEIEAVGRLIIDKKTFEIKEASWEVYRSPGGKLNGRKVVTGLKGVTAYFDAGEDLCRAVGSEAGGLAKRMLTECITGIIQAETSLHIERGYPTQEDYCEYFENYYINSCRYYSNLHRLSRKLSEYVKGYRRRDNHFSRVKSCSVFRWPEGFYTVGNLCDSHQEMGVTVSMNGDGLVIDCTASFLRAPDMVCFENSALMGHLKGIVFPRLGKKQIKNFIGGPQGCVHLVDLVNDLRQVAAAVIKSDELPSIASSILPA